MKIRKLKFFQVPLIKKPLLFIHNKTWLLLAKTLSDKQYIRFKYFVTLKKRIDLNNPVLFQEKLQWIKLNDRKEVYHKMVDKYEVKKFIENEVGNDYVIPTLGVWDSFNEIDFDKLPNQFILKPTFDSGSYYICKDKSTLNIKEVKRKLLTNWGNDYYIWSREWPYKGLKQRIIAEPLLEDLNEKYLRDFKFYCFNGEPEIFYITSDKCGNLPVRQDFFDLEGNHLEIEDVNYRNNPIKPPKLPVNLKKMIDLCKVFAKNTYHLRVDFYEVDGKLYLGEFTFFEGGGFCKFTPEKYNRVLGDWIKLPTDNEH